MVGAEITNRIEQKADGNLFRSIIAFSLSNLRNMLTSRSRLYAIAHIEVDKSFEYESISGATVSSDLPLTYR